jgi:hypothetical protein
LKIEKVSLPLCNVARALLFILARQGIYFASITSKGKGKTKQRQGILASALPLFILTGHKTHTKKIDSQGQYKARQGKKK